MDSLDRRSRQLERRGGRRQPLGSAVLPLLGLVLGLSLLQGHGAVALAIGLLVGQLLQRVR